jgi:hypothetical protein
VVLDGGVVDGVDGVVVEVDDRVGVVDDVLVAGPLVSPPPRDSSTNP